MLGSVTWAVDTAAVGPAAALVGLAQRPTHHLLDRRHVLHQLAAAFAQGGGGKVLENHRVASKGCPRESEVESSVNPFVTALQASHLTRTPPDFFGIGTALTGGGRQLPELIRFQSLYRFAASFVSNRSIVSASIPAAP